MKNIMKFLKKRITKAICLVVLMIVAAILPATLLAIEPKLEGGIVHSLALRDDGTVWAWGQNELGQLGIGVTPNQNIPVQVKELSGIIDIAAGDIHSLALKSDGTVWAWGYNGYGRLGDGTDIQRNSPVQVINLNNVIAISAGGYHSLALKSDGTVWAWGRNNCGQLGDGTTTDRPSPVQVRNLTGITAIAAGGYHSLALRGGNGTVWAWGYNYSGRLGDGTTTNRNTPVQTSINSVTAIAAGDSHSLALRSDGTVRAWGWNIYGQLGDGTYTSRNTPVQVASITGVTAIVAGGYHSLAFSGKSTVTLNVWGWNGDGQLGVGNTTNMWRPMQLTWSTLFVPTKIGAGYYHSLLMFHNGQVYATGSNDFGQLGNGTYTDRNNFGTVSAPAGSSGPLNLIAQKVAVTLNRNGGTGGTASIQAVVGQEMPPITRPTRTGYFFAGYYDALTGGTQYYYANGASARNWNKTTASTLYAQWTQMPIMAIICSVTLDRNGGTGGTASIQAVVGQPMPPITRPTRTGFFFRGYYDSSSTGGTQYYNSDGTSARNWDKNGNATLYARWEFRLYSYTPVTVSLNRNGGAGGTTSVQATPGQPMPTPITRPTREGYTFMGYYETQSGAAKQYYTASGSSAINWDKTSNTTIYARWASNEDPGVGGSTDIVDVELPQFRAWTQNNYLYVSGLTPSELLSVYTETGALVYRKICSSETAEIPMSARGVYIVQQGKLSVKVVN